MDIDSALQWAQANPKDPRAQAVMAKAWAMKNPSDPRSAQIMSKIGQSAQQAQNPQQIPDAADKAAQNNSPNAKPVSLMRGAAQQDISDLQQMDPDMKKGFAKAMIGTAMGGLGGEATLGMGLAGRAATNAGLSGIQKYFSNLLDKKEDSTEGVLGSAALGGGISAAGDAISGGLSKAADRLQQHAMGLNKYTPGIGTEALDQGVRGSREAMSGQVEDAISSMGDKASEAIGKLGRIDSSEAARPLQDYASTLKVGDIIPGNSASEYSGALTRGEEIAGRGEVSAPDAWSLAKLAGQSGYRNQKALQSESAYLAQLEREGYSNALKEAYSKANPGEANEVSDAFSSMAKLYKAQQGLSKPEPLKSGLGLTDMFSAAAGTAAGGPLGGLAGYGLSKAAKSPLVQSYGASALQGLGGATENLSNPELLQGLFGLKQALPTTESK